MSSNKICLIAGSPLSVAPYVKRYMRLLDDHGISYDVIYKDFAASADRRLSNEHVFYYKRVSSPIGKIGRFDAYRRFIRQTVKKNNYQKVVVFTAESAILSFEILNRKKDQIEYILDLRDYSSFLSKPFLMRVFRKALYGANFAVLSSRGFKKWLPDDVRYYLMHNMPVYSVPVQTTPQFGKKVCIGYLGGIGYFESNKAIADSVGNDPNYELLYAGTYPAGYNIKDYCKDQSIENAVFLGKYNDAEKSKIYAGVDLINAVYANDSLTVTTALPNKLYDSAYYKIPIMVCEGTYLAEVVKEYDLGFAVDPQKDCIRDMIAQYVDSFDAEKFVSGCRRLIDRSGKELSEAEDAVLSFLNR